MVTIRQIAACAGVSDSPVTVSVLFGDATPPLSVLSLAAATMQKAVDLNIIAVGWEAFVPVGAAEIEAALEHVRSIYAAVDLAIGNVSYFGISLEESDGHEDVNGNDEALLLKAEWGFPGEAVDVFFVQTWAGDTVGRSPVGGTCSEDDESESGLVVAIEHATFITANTLAHELAHYLGLDHESDEDNLMFKNVPNGEQLTSEQGHQMRRHCTVHPRCRRS